MSAIKIVKGSTYRDTLRWASGECVFVPAQLVPGAPVRFNAPAHGIPNGWLVRVEGSRDFEDGKTYPARVIDADTLEIACVNGSRFKAGPVVVRFNRPVDLAGYSARMQIRDKVGGNILLELDSLAPGGGIVIDEVEFTITREIPADVTAAIGWRKGVFDLEMVQGDYVIKIDSGPATVADEVTV